MNSKQRHQHKWEIRSYSGMSPPFVWERCTVSDCNRERRRKTKGAEAQRIKKYIRMSYRETTALHRVFHDFCRTFLDEKREGSPWKYRGYALMKKIERWARKYPDFVRITGTDDSHHMNSLLCIIEHRTTRRWMGLTVILVPQNGEEPGEFFLYPEDQDALMLALISLMEKRQKIKAREQVWQAKMSRLFRGN